ncbi:hypothetical protein ACFSSC_00760 [Corynebacterium mendelii]|uniref:Uncharacterized protein n=1 Tax=Corynebacterium mendelii TaxID=2765362 RepID=A0A939DZR4_9CORY|nr:hypothetical protein [Corynebacterium mendelii]MBN9643814.1 hypothetical protein [Corynebacterium mendelii]
MSSHAAADNRDATYPAFDGEPHYLEGYRPSSYDSPHSSLNLAGTWVGMGLILSSVVGIGIWVFALGAKSVGSQDSWGLFTIIGVIFMLACWIVGAALIHHSRRHFRAYRARTGRTM